MEKKDIISLIDTYIEEFKSEKNKLGWSIWALISVFCGVIISIYNSLEFFQGNLNYVLILAYAEYNVLDFISRSLFSEKRTQYSDEQLFLKSAAESFSQSNRRTLLLIIYALFFIWFNHEYNLYNPLKITVYIYQILIIAAFVIMMIMSFTNIPIAVSKRKKPNIIIKLFAYIMSFAPLIISCWIFFSEISDIKNVKNEMDLSIKISASLILLYFIFKLSEKNQTLHNLIQLKRDLFKNLIGTDDASNRLDTIIFGLKLDKVMEKELGDTLNAIHNVEFELKQANMYAEKISSLKQDKLSNTSKQAFEDALQIRTHKAKEKMNYALKCYRKFSFKFMTIVNQSEKTPEEKEIIDKLAYNIKKIKTELEKLESNSANKKTSKQQAIESP